jgi:hypothetical protein
MIRKKLLEAEQHVLLRVPGEQWQVQDQRQPVSVDKEQNGQKCVDGGFRDDVRVQAVAEIDGVDVVTAENCQSRAETRPKGGTRSRAGEEQHWGVAHHSKSLYMMVKNTCRNRLTAFINTDNR